MFAAWLCTYIFGVYKRDQVYVQRMGSSSNIDENDASDKKLAAKYKKMSKVEYVLEHLIGPTLDGVCFLCVFIMAAGWVDRH